MTTDIRTLAALLIASATLAACSGDDDSILNDTTTNAPNDQTVYTMTIQATKGGDDDTTRGLALSGKTLSVKWNAGEEVEVMRVDDAINGTYTSIGTLTAAASETGETTLRGTVSGLTTGKALRFFLRGHEMDYTGQKGVLLNSDDAVNSIEAKYDYAATTDDVTAYTVSGSTVTVSGGITLTSQQAVVKFTLKDLSGNAINATSLTIKENTGTNGHICLWRDANKISGNTLGRLTITPASATSTVYAAIYDYHNVTGSTSSYTLEATDADGNIYVYTKEGILFATGKYYEVTVKMQYTYTHTLAVSAVGDIVDIDGRAYAVADKENKLPSGVADAGMVAYKSGSNGLVIALYNDSEMTWYEANGTSGAAAHTPAIDGHAWKLPSEDDWLNMLEKYPNSFGNTYNCTPLNARLSNAGGNSFPSGNGYWSSTTGSTWTSTTDPDNYAVVIGMLLDEGVMDAYTQGWHKESHYYVRACFAF